METLQILMQSISKNSSSTFNDSQELSQQCIGFSTYIYNTNSNWKYNGFSPEFYNIVTLSNSQLYLLIDFSCTQK